MRIRCVLVADERRSVGEEDKSHKQKIKENQFGQHRREGVRGVKSRKFVFSLSALLIKVKISRLCRLDNIRIKAKKNQPCRSIGKLVLEK